MTRNKIFLCGIAACAVVALAAVGVRYWVYGKKTVMPVVEKVRTRVQARTARDTATVRRDTVPKVDYNISGTLRYDDGQPAADVAVSDGYTVAVTDSTGHYAFRRDSLARFVWYTVPADCEVPVHADNDRTAAFYLPVSKNKKVYDFTLQRLPGGRQHDYRLVVLGDPQVTNAKNPFYTDATDNPVQRSDIERFTSETMADLRSWLSTLPDSIPVYGLSMGDDVQYYGGYNAALEMQIRRALGSTRMRLFSVIGNHDQDGKALYRSKWMEAWGPDDYSFDRGDEHYVCLNNVQFFHGASYYSPGELSARQMRWLKQDLALVPHDRKVVLCYHIPFTFGNRPSKHAEALTAAGEDGHYSSARLSELLALLAPFTGGAELFCGHTHFAINHEIDYAGQHLLEHCHAAACGNIWQSNVNLCGAPNGYYIYSFSGTAIADCRYKGTFWDIDRQMALFRSDTDYGGETYAADWDLERGRGTIVANVFNADSRWRVVAVENGVEHPMQRLSGKGQDAFATGYHRKYCQCAPYSFISKQNTYLLMNHLYYYTPSSHKAHVTVRATDPYGHTYTASSDGIVTEPYYNYAHYYDRGR